MNVLHHELVREARDWAKDCIWADVEPEDIDQLSDEEVLACVADHYEGGLRQLAINAMINEEDP